MEKKRELEGRGEQGGGRVGPWQPLKQTPRSLHSPYNYYVAMTQQTHMRAQCHIQIGLSIKRDYDKMCFFLFLISLFHTGEVLDSLAAKPKTACPLFTFYRPEKKQKREKEPGNRGKK